MFKDINSPRHWPLILAVLYGCMAVPNSWLPELSSAEATMALSAMAIEESGSMFVAGSVDGVTVSPLSAWLLAHANAIVPLNEFIVRLPAIVALALLAVACGGLVWRVAGPQAAAVSASATMSSVIAINSSLRGEPAMLGALLLNFAWFTWYVLSREKRRWLIAWFVSSVLVFFAVLTIGLKAIFIFYFPLLMLRRPLKIIRRLGHIDHLICLVSLLLFVAIWFVMTPYKVASVAQEIQNFSPHGSFVDYARHLAIYPVRALSSYVPWVFLVWPAFCIAFRPLESDPALSQFARTICVSLFYFYWLIPIGGDVLLPLIGPLAILCGLNYAICVRRHGRHLSRLPAAIGAVTLLSVGILIGCSWWRTELFVVQIQRNIWVPSVITLIFASAISFLLWRRKIAQPIWLLILLSVVTARLAYVATVNVHQYELGSKHRRAAARLIGQLPITGTVYELNSGILDTPNTQYYLRRPVVSIRTTDAIPSFDDTVYVLGKDRRPVSRNRRWHAVGPPVVNDDTLLRMWRGQLELLSIRPDSIDLYVKHDQNPHLPITENVVINNHGGRSLTLRTVNISRPEHVSVDVSRDTLQPLERYLPHTLEPGADWNLTVRIHPGWQPDRVIAEQVTFVFLIGERRIERTLMLRIHPATDIP